MNYLAHAFLSNNNENLLIGNFIADHMRGNNFKNYPAEVIEGIYLHRRIDSFTDAHVEFKKTKRVFYEGFEKHSGILVDIYFDHLLAKNFEKYHPQKLQHFSSAVYETYKKNLYLMPQSSERFLNYVLQNNIYTSYSLVEGIEKVLFHLSHRINHNVSLQNSVSIFKNKEDEIAQSFELFMSDVLNEFNR